MNVKAPSLHSVCLGHFSPAGVHLSPDLTAVEVFQEKIRKKNERVRERVRWNDRELALYFSIPNE